LEKLSNAAWLSCLRDGEMFLRYTPTPCSCRPTLSVLDDPLHQRLKETYSLWVAFMPLQSVLVAPLPSLKAASFAPPHRRDQPPGMGGNRFKQDWKPSRVDSPLLAFRSRQAYFVASSAHSRLISSVF